MRGCDSHSLLQMTFCRVILIKEVLVVEADAIGDGSQAGSDVGEELSVVVFYVSGSAIVLGPLTEMNQAGRFHRPVSSPNCSGAKI